MKKKKIKKKKMLDEEPRRPRWSKRVVVAL
jgi:hypothetical protein